MLQSGLSCRAVVLLSLHLGVAQEELSGLFWDAVCVVPQGELPAGASFPLQELHLDFPAKAEGWYLLLKPPERQGESVNQISSGNLLKQQGHLQK